MITSNVKRSLGIAIDATAGAVVDQVLFTVPVGYRCIVHMFLMANTSGANSVVSAKWTNDGTAFAFMDGSTLAANDHIQFGGNGLWLVLDEADNFIGSVSNGHSADVLISYELSRSL